MLDPNIRPATEHALKLFDALKSSGIDAKIQYWDGHKTVDIAILRAKLFIEVDGIQHFTDPEQIMRDFKRSHYSDGDDFSTFYVTNQLIDRHLNEVVNALVKVIEIRSREI
jgi:very-short-patch-repair endonuclease